MSKLRIFLLSLMVVGALVQLDAADKKKNKLKVKPTEKKEKIEKLSDEAQKLFKVLPPEIYTHIISFIKDEFLKFSDVNKEFRNLIFEKDEHGQKKIKDKLLRGILFRKHNSEDFAALSQDQKEKIFWEFFTETKCFLLLRNFEALVGRDLDVNKIVDEKTKETLLHMAADLGDADIVRWLIKKGADVHAVVTSKKIFKYKSNWNWEEDDKDLLEMSRYAPIHYAVRWGHVTVFRYLKEAMGESWMENCIGFQGDVIDLAALSSSMEMLEEVRRCVGDDAIFFSKACLEVPARHGCVNTLSFLLKGRQHYDPLPKELLAEYPLRQALHAGHEECVKEFFWTGAQLEEFEGDDYYVSFLHGVVTLDLPVSKRLRLIRLLIFDGELNINKRIENGYGIETDEIGDTPLHTAARFGEAEIMEELLGLGSDEEITNEKGKYALDLYKEFCEKEKKEVDPEIVKLLGKSSKK